MSSETHWYNFSCFTVNQATPHQPMSIYVTELVLNTETTRHSISTLYADIDSIVNIIMTFDPYNNWMFLTWVSKSKTEIRWWW